MKWLVYWIAANKKQLIICSCPLVIVYFVALYGFNNIAISLISIAIFFVFVGFIELCDKFVENSNKRINNDFTRN